MESFGDYLKREREMRGVQLREVAQITKITVRALDALENARFEELGGEIFVRGFLRNYARYLGLDPEDVVLRYEEYRLQTAPPEDATAVVELPGFPPARRSALLAGAAVAGLFALSVFIKMVSKNDTPAAPIAATLTVAEPQAAHPVTAPVAVTETAVRAAIVLEIKSEGASYVKLWIDGAAPIEREFAPGMSGRYKAQKRIEILTGNAGALSLTLNDKQLPALGPLGRVRRRVITSEGVFPP